MKVLLTATVQSHIVQFHKPLVEMLHTHGCEVHVAAKDNLAEKNGLKLDFVERVFDVPFARSPKSMDNIEAYKQLKKIINEEHYDVIHCNTPMGGIVTRLAARAARKQGTRIFYTAHGFHFYQGAPKKNWVVYYPIEKFFANHYTDKLITITSEDYKLASEKFKCKVERIHGVGVDEKRYYPVDKEQELKLRNELGFGPSQKIVLCVGELLPNKNQKMAIHMMKKVVKQYPDAQLLLAGNGPEKENLEVEICACGLESNVKMLGYCTCLEKYQRVADLLVACSHREGLPLNLVEAMLTGNPVIASINRGHKELIRTGENGYLVKNETEMAEKVLLVLSNDELQERTQNYARNFAQNYGFVHVKRELEQIYYPQEV